VFSDGPFVESKEYLAGVWVWEAPDLDVALKLATGGVEGLRSQIEVRPVPVSGACGANRQTLPRRRGTRRQGHHLRACEVMA